MIFFIIPKYISFNEYFLRLFKDQKGNYPGGKHCTISPLLMIQKIDKYVNSTISLGIPGQTCIRMIFKKKHTP